MCALRGETVGVTVQAAQSDAYELIHRGILAFSRAERAGMRVDVGYCRTKSAHLTRQAERLEQKFDDSEFAAAWRKEYGVKMNPASNDQLGRMMYDVWGITPPKQTKGGKGSTDEGALKQIDLPELQYILRLRKLRKLRDTYLGNFLKEQVDGVIHPSINLHTVKSYRSSVNNPNLQNVPTRDKESMHITRRALFPREGYQLLEVDFSGIEVAISAAYNRDPNLIQYIMDDSTDMHGDLAHQIFTLDKWDTFISEKGFKSIPVFDFLRKATKNSFTFPQFYGDYYGNSAISYCRWTGLPQGGEWKSGQGPEMPDGGCLADHMAANGVRSFDDFVERLKDIEDDFWGRRFKVYGRWREDWYAAYTKRGYLDTLTGFRCKGLMTKNQVINTPIQAAAFHCLLWTFIRVDEIAQREGWRSRLVMQIHDSLVVDVHPPELAYVAGIIQQVATQELSAAWRWICVPMAVEADLCPVDHSWSDKQSYELPEVT